MFRRCAIYFAVVLATAFSYPVHAEELMVEQLKAQGGVALAGDDLKKFLEGATLRYENAQFATQMRLEADGRWRGSPSGASAAPAPERLSMATGA